MKGRDCALNRKAGEYEVGSLMPRSRALLTFYLLVAS